MYIDFEGRSDGESIRKILQQVKPRSLCLVRGHTQATESLAEFCRKNKDITNSIFVPRLNETLDATNESSIFQVTTRDTRKVYPIMFYTLIIKAKCQYPYVRVMFRLLDTETYNLVHCFKRVVGWYKILCFVCCRQVKLKDSVVSALQFSQTKDMEIAWIDAVLDVTQAITDTSFMHETERGLEKGEYLAK